MLTTTYARTTPSKSHSAFAKATVIQKGVELPGEIPLVGGAVSVDAGAAVRRRATGLQLVGYYPEIDPYTCELKLWRSVGDEYVPLGVFRLENPTFSSDRSGVTTALEAFDRAYVVSQLRLPRPWTVQDTPENLNGTKVDVAIRQLLQSRAPWLEFDFTASNYRVPTTTFEEQTDPWEASLLMAEGAGLELFFNPLGRCVLRPLATADSANVVVEFGKGARILKVERKQVTRDVKNHAIVTGENTELPAPVRAEAYDDDPQSPTYYLSDFGDRPTWLRSQFITTEEQCLSAAKALVARSAGRAESVRMDFMPDGALDANDVVSIYRPEIGVDAIHALDTLEIPLFVNAAMTCATRERRVA